MENTESLWSVSSALITSNCSTIRNVMCVSGPYIFYCITNTVLVYKYDEQKVISCLNGHEMRINGISLLYSKTGTSLCTVDSNKTMIIWHTNDVESLIWNKQIYPAAHDAEINNVTSTVLNNVVYIVTFCLNGNLKIWKGQDLHENLNVEFVDQLLFGSNLQETITIFPANKRYIMMLTGGFDKYIHVYTVDTELESKEKVQYHTSLIGHTNSIRDFCVTQKYAGNQQYIFSCSQD